MSDPILNIERAGHKIVMDRREGYLRVTCNGAIHAQFNEGVIGEIKALEHAISFTSQLETNALKYPKDKSA